MTPNTPATQPRFMRMLRNVQTGARVSEDRQDIYKVPGDNKVHRIRIVPGTYGGEQDGMPGRNWYVELFQHWFPNPQSQKGFSKSCVCRSAQNLRGKPVGTKESCPFCNRWHELREEERTISADILTATGSEAAALKARKSAIKDEIREMSYRTSYAVQIIDREDSNKLKIFYMPKTCFDQILVQYTSVSNERGEALFTDPEMKLVVEGLKKDPESEKYNNLAMQYCDVFDATQGYDIDVSKKTEAGQTKYTAAIRRMPCAALPTHEAVDELLNNMLDLETVIEESLTQEDLAEIDAGVQAAIEKLATQGKQLTTATQDPDAMSFRRPAGAGAAPPRRAPATPPPPAAEDDDIDYGEGTTGADATEGFESDAEGVDEADAEYLDTTPAVPAALPPRPAPARRPAPERTAPPAATGDRPRRSFQI